MEIRKKTTPESETLKPQETLKAAPKAAAKPARARTSPAESETSAKKAARANIPAATHKAPARKSVAPEKPETPAFDPALHHDEISLEAYHNWVRRGCPHGSEHEDWLAAVAAVRARYAH